MAPIIITIVLAVVVTGVVWGAARGALPANGMVGIRTQKTQRSEGAWRAAHRAALRLVLPASAVVVLAGARSPCSLCRAAGTRRSWASCFWRCTRSCWSARGVAQRAATDSQPV
ncbi:SdpI family protein [Cellulomonas sp. Y8]|uniref:SdpI family protein n=1 Tax=Cellulomonas sp. Y8 TaxID=2591145 RepID=UPI0011CB3F41